MHSCSDCKLALEPIRLVDATDSGAFSSGGARHVDLSYAPINSNQGWFTGTVGDLINITGMICPKCRRISLYG